MEKTRGEVLNGLFQNINTGILVFDDFGTIFANAMAKEAIEVKRVLEYGKERFLRDGVNLIGRSVEKFDSESGVWFVLNYSLIDWFDGRLVTMITAIDCTIKKKSYKKQVFQQYNDILTGIYNNAKCELDIKDNMEEAVSTGKKGAVLFIDLDDFKNINDGLGRAYGDMLLKQIAIELRNISGISRNCYRMGGDEFAVIITPNEYKSLQRILANIYALFNQPWNLLDSECYCTMSMGIVIFPDDASDVSSVLKKADVAMYTAKRSGKNKYRYYEDKGESSLRKLEVESSMRQAVAEACEEFMVYYQPIVDTETEKCVSCEALIRWNSRTLGFVGPGEFIPIAEYLGLINEIGDYVLECACLQCKKWNENGHPDFHVNVNLSVIQLLQNNVVSNIQMIIEKTGINPKNLTLEVTENLAIKDMDRMMDIIAGIKKLGVKMALDDFGTGYSSLNYIKQLDFDVIKVDKSFVDDILEDEYEQAFVELIVDLSSKIGAKVCVEGIEEKAQFDLLKEIGANLIQGYYFSRPLPAEQFEANFLK